MASGDWLETLFFIAFTLLDSFFASGDNNELKARRIFGDFDRKFLVGTTSFLEVIVLTSDFASLGLGH